MKNRENFYFAVLVLFLMFASALGVMAQGTMDFTGKQTMSLQELNDLVTNNVEVNFNFNGGLQITGESAQEFPNDKCVFVAGNLTGSTANTLDIKGTNLSVTGSVGITIIDDPNDAGVYIQGNGASSCDGTLPVEVVDFRYDINRQAFFLQVTDEYDISHYRIVITDQDGIEIGYRWWYAYETEVEMFRTYEIPMQVPINCDAIEIMYAVVYKKEISGEDYEQVSDVISIQN